MFAKIKLVQGFEYSISVFLVPQDIPPILHQISCESPSVHKVEIRISLKLELVGVRNDVLFINSYDTESAFSKVLAPLSFRRVGDIITCILVSGRKNSASAHSMILVSFV